MKKQEIFNRLKEAKGCVTIQLKDDADYTIYRDIENMWLRKVWGAYGHLNDEELAIELEEELGEEIAYIWVDL